MTNQKRPVSLFYQTAKRFETGSRKRNRVGKITNNNTITMTNAQSMQQSAIEAMEQGKLTSWEVSFVESIKNYTKKDLRDLSRKQYDVLRKIAAKAN